MLLRLLARVLCVFGAHSFIYSVQFARPTEHYDIVHSMCRRCGGERRFYGSGTVWRSYENGARAGTFTESFLADLVDHARFKRQQSPARSGPAV